MKSVGTYEVGEVSGLFLAREVIRGDFVEVAAAVVICNLAAKFADLQILRGFPKRPLDHPRGVWEVALDLYRGKNFTRPIASISLGDSYGNEQ